MRKPSFLILLLTLLLSVQLPLANAAKLEDYLDRKEIQKKISEAIADQDINFNLDLGNIDFIDGINIANKYRYNVEGSYISNYYTRIDKWDMNAGINVGQIIRDYVEIPLDFQLIEVAVSFVRQFPTKKEALKAIPYAPNKLPLNANMALKNLEAGDFVSMPANLSVGVSMGTSTSFVSPLIINASGSIYGVLSGEFTVQVFKIDSTHVRLKLITQRSRGTGSNISAGFSFDFFGIKLIDQQIERIFDRDLIQLGFNFTPNSQFILDYIFDLKDPKAKEAYNQILGSTLKFKDIVVTEQVLNASELKDKMISCYDKADALYEEDKNIDPKLRRVQRIFKGFNSAKGHTRHMKFSLLMGSYSKDRTYTENKVTFVDKNEQNMEFFYPTYSRYLDTRFGKKWIFELKDQSYQNNFGLIPRFNLENSKEKSPDLGFTFERKDRYFTSYEQKAVEQFLLGQIPISLAQNIDLDQWRDGTKKTDSRIFFQLVLKAQGFAYLKDITAEEMRSKLLAYVAERKKIHVIEQTEEDTKLEKLKDFLFINRFIEKERLISLADSLTRILKNENNDAEDMLKKLIALNEFKVFDRIGVGFLISLLPQDKLAELVYMKLEMMGKDLIPLSYEAGKLNYRALYKELTTIQSRLSNRSYDLRVSEDDMNMEDFDVKTLEHLVEFPY